MREKSNFSNTLIMWYLNNQRDLPWRKSRNPFYIWLSEIILQQTRVAQGTSYYEKFIDEFNDIFALAEADETHILKLWQGLGYYSRARNLHSTAKIISNDYNGQFPETYDELIKLKGIGDYTASAIASIAFNKPHAVVDGNVYRVLSRIFGIKTAINERQGITEFKSLAEKLLDHHDPGTHNQALMEFGALVCLPKNPKCETCIFNGSCYALQHKMIDQLPLKIKKLKIRKRYFNYLVVDHEGDSTVIRKREHKDIWQNLFEFPVHETKDDIFDELAFEKFIFDELSISGPFTLKKYNQKPIIHKLTHQTLYASFWIVEPEEKLNNLTAWHDLKEHALPVLLQNFVDKYHSPN
ncbi:A/G-specific adenine glycosylase [Lutimonas halocynthiae]|uniref:A/G-specific adenine glycosylase n=1 Tax=Lutimonas halocynthiae TaxID=1446477 RepID=UPI0025B35C60|nr:A/G-specific adenine glycosylase [Lutimonas halocynthiae]MDN3641886.1 A/G-specific adenine glycosylase [Lutimonas halocynthiae]